MGTEPAIASHPRSSERWSHLRFSVVGPLLAAPPGRGELGRELKQLAQRKWRHPMTGEWVSFGASTIERWYYAALREKMDPVKALRRKVRADHGRYRRVSAALAERICAQYRQHPSWSYQLHADNLAVVAEKEPAVGPCPSYACLARYMKAHGLIKRPRKGPVHSPGARQAEERFEAREVRSYESEYLNALWHADFHHGSRRVLLETGAWAYPVLLGVLDDCSRLCCHAQWYLREAAEEFCHGLGQALQKRSLPRALMTDNGKPMTAGETQGGLDRLSILWEGTLMYSPNQNGKQEAWWSSVEGRLLPMLEGVVDLTLGQLNDATQAWVEMEYNRKLHSEIGTSPLDCYLKGKDVGRPCPTSQELSAAFTAQLRRTQRRSDGTITVMGVRFEVPSRYGHWPHLYVRVRSWDLREVYLCGPKTEDVLCRLFPLDKRRNADGQRALRASPLMATPVSPEPGGVAPLLQKLIAEYAATGLPPAYLPKVSV